MDNCSFNRKIVEAINTWYKREYKKENTRGFMSGRKHFVKYHKVMLKDSNVTTYTFKIDLLVFYFKDIPSKGDIIVSVNNKSAVKVLKVTKDRILVNDI